MYTTAETTAKVIRVKDPLAKGNEEILTKMASHPSNAIVITDIQGRVEWVNATMERLSGYSLDDLLGRKPGEVLQGPDTYATTVMAIHQALQRQEPIETELLNYSKDGRTYWVSLSILPIFDDQGQLRRFISAQTDITLQKTRDLQQLQELDNVKQSIEYAARVQRALLPNTSVLSKYCKDYFILYQPRDVLSGDFYWMTEYKNQLYLAVADCTGHGVPAAILSVLGMSMLTQSLQEASSFMTPAILRTFDEKLTNALRADDDDKRVYDGMEMVLARINPIGNELSFAGGMMRVFFSQGGQIQEYRTDARMLGDQNHNMLPEFTANRFSIAPGDALYLFSDGLQDQFGGDNGRKFSRKRIIELLNQHADKNMAQQKEILTAELRNWQGRHDQTDDILFIGIRF